MSRLGYATVTTLLFNVFSALFITVWIVAPHPRLIWNASASAPIGLYRVTPDPQPVVGDIVAISPPASLARYLAVRRYLPVGVPLLKHVAGTVGARICRRGNRVSVDRKLVAIALSHDSHGRPLPVWRGCRIVGAQQIFLLNPAADSMDSRYFGPMPLAGMLGQATPVFTRDRPGTPLRWRGLAVPPAPSVTKREAVHG